MIDVGIVGHGLTMLESNEPPALPDASGLTGGTTG